MDSLRSKSYDHTYNINQKPSIIRSKPNINGICKKHPKHKQSPGVCSICLGEKLSQLPNSNNASSSSSSRTKGMSSSSSSDISSLSSSNASSCSSPVMINYTCRFDNSSARKSTRVLGLKKSRSMASIFQRGKHEEDENNVGKNFKGKKGFWSKLLPRRNKGLSMHSKTTRERIITAAVH